MLDGPKRVDEIDALHGWRRLVGEFLNDGMLLILGARRRGKINMLKYRAWGLGNTASRILKMEGTILACFREELWDVVLFDQLFTVNRDKLLHLEIIYARTLSDSLRMEVQVDGVGWPDLPIRGP